MRMKMMTHGILNKVILILMISVLMYEDLLLGLLALLIFFEMTNIKYEKESLMEYFSCGKKHIKKFFLSFKYNGLYFITK